MSAGLQSVRNLDPQSTLPYSLWAPIGPQTNVYRFTLEAHESPQVLHRATGVFGEKSSGI